MKNIKFDSPKRLLLTLITITLVAVGYNFLTKQKAKTDVVTTTTEKKVESKDTAKVVDTKKVVTPVTPGKKDEVTTLTVPKVTPEVVPPVTKAKEPTVVKPEVKPVTKPVVITKSEVKKTPAPKVPVSNKTVIKKPLPKKDTVQIKSTLPVKF